MSVSYNNGIGFGGGGSTAYIEMGYKSSPAAARASKSPATNSDTPDSATPSDDTFNGAPWASWGEDNLLPEKMAEDIEDCGVLNAGIDGKSRFGLGYGAKPFTIEGYENKEEILKPYEGTEVLEWMDENDVFNSSLAWFKDSVGMGNHIARFKFTKDGSKIGLGWRHDVSEMRLEKKKKGVINNVYLCAEYDRVFSYEKKDDRVLKIQLLPNIGPATSLMDLPAENRRSKEYAFVGRIPVWNRHYYSYPLWLSAKKWVDIAKGIPEMKAAMFNNNIRLKYMVIIYDSYWTRVFGQGWDGYSQSKKDQLRQEVYDKIDEYLVGSKNAYKSIFVPGNWDPITKMIIPEIEIKPIDDKTKQGELLPDSAAANSEILFALMMNPALMGADMPGGPYSGGAGSGSNIREAALVQVMIQEFERQQISRILNIPKRINNWDPKIVWRFPGLVLTTLDKGKSTEPVTN